MTTRLEIQGLRALAVVAVLIFHIWPSSLSGGYIGVDVFFVISGYLITALLLRELQSTGTISLTNFYARRIRRLLPAATLVIVVVAMLTPVMPSITWESVSVDIVASIFYVQNWWLASQAVDYLAEGNAPGMLQHYWSLSVEEQYYIIWPLLIVIVSTLLFKCKRFINASIAGLIVLIAILSFGYSIYLSHARPELAYFSTFTRIWELAIGGILAVFALKLNSIPNAVKASLTFSGLLLILIACLTFDTSTVFPGYSALLPTIGAAMVIIGGKTDYKLSGYHFLSLKPMQYIGNISYSLYLWHWPIIVLVHQFYSEISLLTGLAIIVVAIVLSHLTKVFVEDKYRYAGQKGSKAVFPLGITFGSFALCIVAASMIWLSSDIDPSKPESLSIQDLKILLEQQYNPDKPTVPSLENARKDNPDVYKFKCHVDQISAEPLSCEFGDKGAPYTVALVGDSHAAHWLPSLQQLLNDKKDWRIITFTKSACTFNGQPVSKGENNYPSCTVWNKNVMSQLKQISPDIVVTSQSSGHRALGAENNKHSHRLLADGLLSHWSELDQLGINVVVIRDTPWMKVDVPKCLSSVGTSIASCSTAVEDSVRNDSILVAMESKPNVTFLDFNEKLCGDDICSPVHGQVLIWRDRHHLTVTYARTLADGFEPILDVVN